MRYRQYMAQFFQIDCATIEESKKEDFVYNLFALEIDRFQNKIGNTLSPTPSGYQCELRDLTQHAGVIMGCVGLLRPDAPSIREVHGTERQVDANPGEHFLEKNYFLYFKSGRILAWQFNLLANHVNNLSTLLTSISGQKQTITCNVLLDDAFAFDNNAEIQLVDFRVRTPKTQIQKQAVEQLNPNSWKINPFRVMAETDANSLSLTLSTGRKNSNLSGGLAGMVKGLLDSPQTRRLKIKMGDAEEPIDLLARRVKRKIHVQMDGRYANPKSAWEALQAAKDDADVEIKRCI